MAPQNVKGATTKPTEASAQNPSGLTHSQIVDLFCFVTAVCGKSTGTIELPAVPADAEKCVVDMGAVDSIAVWLVDGWPVAASDEMTLTHWVMHF
ncbi:ribulokinase [Acerihabitans sp. TG2]|uniref:ribulokinase n=1 Tax=Acerihabitans sp. TG2 TaxID=3096008 RepID=UPI002B23265D|nr:ribulokinase [Acerihabitans sp. TG2]MEA9392671.1 ribulokinase [Acerihabitans sp. TG2]